MSFSHTLAITAKEREKVRRRRFYATHLFELARMLGYDRLTETFHRPMCEEMDRRSKAFYAGNYHLDEMDLWPRGHYKTTLGIVRCIQDWLHDPTLTRTWWHAVEEKAQLASQAIGHHLQSHKELRELLSEEAKPPAASRARKWNKAGGFRLPCNIGKADPSMYATGQGSEATGGHSDIVELDDVIGENTIQDSLMPKVRRWLGTTVTSVLNPGGRKRYRGTHWDDDDIYMDMRKSKDCDVTLRACYETDGEPDWKGAPVLFTRRQLQKIRRSPGMTEFAFSCQYMNDPLPVGERRWDQAAEQTCTAKEAYERHGETFVLSDPAPAGLSLRADKDKVRGEAGKDWWSIAVVRICNYGDYQDYYLLDGAHSQSWGEAEGFSVACDLLRKWHSRLFFNEAYTGSSWEDEFLKQAKRKGLTPEFEWVKDRGRSFRRIPRFKDSYSKNQKNLRFESFCDKNNGGHFYICNSVPQEFLLGDDDKTGCMTQIRKWMPLQNGRNNLKWDDDADSVARMTDSAVLSRVPLSANIDVQLMNVFEDEDEMDEEQPQRSRYCGY